VVVQFSSVDVFVGLGVPNETVGTLGLDVLVRVRVSASLLVLLQLLLQFADHTSFLVRVSVLGLVSEGSGGNTSSGDSTDTGTGTSQTGSTGTSVVVGRSRVSSTGGESGRTGSGKVLLTGDGVTDETLLRGSVVSVTET